MILLLGRSKDELLAHLQFVIKALGEVRPDDTEPMMNLFVSYADECWTIWMFPRGAHRPSVYGTEPDQYLISPGAIDVAGLLIAPRLEDFERIDEATVRQIYADVMLPPEAMSRLRHCLLDSAARFAEAARAAS